MVFNATFNNISLILYSFISGENLSIRRKPPTWQTLSHNVESGTHLLTFLGPRFPMHLDFI